ncbi:hypothetical protein D3C76_1289620 [compost metagenome]
MVLSTIKGSSYPSSGWFPSLFTLVRLVYSTIRLVQSVQIRLIGDKDLQVSYLSYASNMPKKQVLHCCLFLGSVLYIPEQVA